MHSMMGRIRYTMTGVPAADVPSFRLTPRPTPWGKLLMASSRCNGRPSQSVWMVIWLENWKKRNEVQKPHKQAVLQGSFHFI